MKSIYCCFILIFGLKIQMIRGKCKDEVLLEKSTFERENDVKICIAQCLNLVDPNVVIPTNSSKKLPFCEYSKSSGLITGADCRETFYPRSDAKFALFCLVFNEEGLRSNFSVWKLLKTRLCTHIALAPLVKYDVKTNTLVTNTELADYWLPAIREAKAFGTKMIVEIGTYSDFIMAPETFSTVASKEDLRKKFATSVKDLILKYDLDGVSLKWYYPVCPQQKCVHGVTKDKGNLVKLVQALKLEIGPYNKIVTVGLPNVEDPLKGFDFPALEPYIDFYLINSFSYGTPYQSKQSSPLPEIRKQMDTIASRSSYKNLLMGISCRINIVELINKQKNEVGASLNAGLIKYLPYKDACKIVRSGKYKDFKNPEESNFATKDLDWFSYEDYASLQKKVNYVKRVGAAGIWLDFSTQDDIQNECGCGVLPMTRMTAELLRAEDGCNYKACP